MAKYKKRPDGRYIRYATQILISYYSNGKRKVKTLYAKTIKELEKKEVEYRNTLYKGITIYNEKLTFGEWAEQWLKTYKKDVSERTVSRYKSIIDKYLLSLSGIQLSKIKIQDLQQILMDMLDKGYSSSIKLTKTVLTQIFKQAIINDYIVKNPTTGLKLPKYEVNERRALTDEEREIILSVSDFTLKEKAFIQCGLYAGLRRGEILSLRKSDIDFEQDIIHIRRTLVYNTNQASIKNGTKTKAGIRDIPLYSTLKETLAMLTKESKSEYLFTMRDGNLYSKTAFNRMWQQIMKKINRDRAEDKQVKITSHYLRHTYATDLYYANVDLKTAQYLLGHEDIKTTIQIYTSLRLDTNSVNEKLSAYFSQSKVSQNEEIDGIKKLDYTVKTA